MNFSKVLYFPSSHWTTVPFHTGWFSFVPLLRASAGVGAEKPIIPATPAVCPRLLCGTFSGTWNYIISHYFYLFSFFHFAVDLTPLWVAVQLFFFFFKFQKGNVFRFVLQKNPKKSKKKRKNKRLFYPILAVLSLWRFIFCLSIYLICCLFMFLWGIFWECNINQLGSAFIFLIILYREFPGKTVEIKDNLQHKLVQKWNE